MKRILSVLIVLVLVLAVSAPAFAAIDQYTVLTEEMLGQKAVRVNTSLLDAIEGKVFYADVGDNFAVQVPGFMQAPSTVSIEDMVALIDNPSQTMLVVARLELDLDLTDAAVPELDVDLEGIEDFDDFAELLRELFDEEMVNIVEGVTFEFGSIEQFEVDGMAFGMLMDFTMSDAESTLNCTYIFTVTEDGDFYMVMGVYLDLTDAEREQLLAVPANLVLYTD